MEFSATIRRPRALLTLEIPARSEFERGGAAPARIIKDAEEIGKGMFCRAFRKGSRVFLVTSENMRELYTRYDISESKHLPGLLWLGQMPSPPFARYNDDDRDVYEMPYYRPIKGNGEQGKAARALVKEIKRIYQEAQSMVDSNKFLWERYMSEVSSQFLNLLEGSEGRPKIETTLPKSLIKDLRLIFDEAHSYSSYPCFDFHNANFSLGPRGTLILRDVVADAEKIQEMRKR